MKTITPPPPPAPPSLSARLVGLGKRVVRSTVWRMLPRAARERFLLHLSLRRAPKITPAAAFRQPLIIVGLFGQASGLGAAARASHDALKKAGHEVYGIDVTDLFVHDAVASEFRFADGRHLVGQATAFIHVTGSRVPMVLTALGSDFVTDKRIVAHWFWELPKAPQDWRHAMPFVHEIHANSAFVADAVRPLAGDRPVHVVPYPLPLREPIEPMTRTTRPFTALVVFNISSNFTRKNPCAAITAFRKAFGDDPEARLIVKYSNAFAWPKAERMMRQAAQGAANIDLIGEVLEERALETLYAQADVVMSLHRSEGLGLVVAEAMMRGLPVIATDWSSTAEFMDATCGMPIPYTLVSVDDPQGNYPGRDTMWAEPDVDAAAAALKRLRAEPDLAVRVGAAARERIAARFDLALYPEKIASRIEQATAISHDLPDPH